jgi:hypothetical protein
VRTGKKVALAIVAFAAVVTLTLTGCAALLFSGGAGNVIRNLKPAPDVESRTITRKRLRATEAVEAALATLDAGTGFTSYATSTDDRCYKGENDWKIKEGYAHRCTVRITRFHGMSGDFRANMLGLEHLLEADGWQLPRSTFADLPPATFREMFATYYDVHCSGNQIAVFGSGRIARPTCEVSRLPRSRSDGYRKSNLVLWIECAERGESNLFMMDFVQRVPIGALFKERDRNFNLYQKTNLQEVEAQFREITASHRYVLSVTVQETYFEN